MFGLSILKIVVNPTVDFKIRSIKNTNKILMNKYLVFVCPSFELLKLLSATEEQRGLLKSFKKIKLERTTFDDSSSFTELLRFELETEMIEASLNFDLLVE